MPPLLPAPALLGSMIWTRAPRWAQAHAMDRPKIPAPRMVISVIALAFDCALTAVERLI